MRPFQDTIDVVPTILIPALHHYPNWLPHLTVVIITINSINLHFQPSWSWSYTPLSSHYIHRFRQYNKINKTVIHCFRQEESVLLRPGGWELGDLPIKAPERHLVTEKVRALKAGRSVSEWAFHAPDGGPLADDAINGIHDRCNH